MTSHWPAIIIPADAAPGSRGSFSQQECLRSGCIRQVGEAIQTQQ